MVRTTVIMIAVLAALAAGVFALERTNPRPTTEQTFVLEVKDSDVQRLDVTTSAGSTAFERLEPVGWKFIASGEEADSSRVGSVVNRLARLRSSAKVLDQVTDHSPYGLAVPSITAALTMKDGSVHRIVVGNKTVNEAAYYAMVEGGTQLHNINTLIVGDMEKLVSEPPRRTPTPEPTPRSTATPTPNGTEAVPAPTIGIPVPQP